MDPPIRFGLRVLPLTARLWFLKGASLLPYLFKGLSQLPEKKIAVVLPLVCRQGKVTQRQQEGCVLMPGSQKCATALWQAAGVHKRFALGSPVSSHKGKVTLGGLKITQAGQGCPWLAYRGREMTSQNQFRADGL